MITCGKEEIKPSPKLPEINLTKEGNLKYKVIQDLSKFFSLDNQGSGKNKNCGISKFELSDIAPLQGGTRRRVLDDADDDKGIFVTEQFVEQMEQSLIVDL